MKHVANPHRKGKWRRRRKFDRWFRRQQRAAAPEGPQYKWRLQVEAGLAAHELAAHWRMTRDGGRYFRWFYDELRLARCVEACRNLGVRGSTRRYLLEREVAKPTVTLDPPIKTVALPVPRNPPPPKAWKDPVEARAQRALAIALRGG